MNESGILDERDEDEAVATSPGTTMTLTASGWEFSEYLEPADDWALLNDGSYLSPDGAHRTWPLGAETT